MEFTRAETLNGLKEFESIQSNSPRPTVRIGVYVPSATRSSKNFLIEASPACLHRYGACQVENEEPMESIRTGQNGQRADSTYEIGEFGPEIGVQDGV